MIVYVIFVKAPKESEICAKMIIFYDVPSFLETEALGKNVVYVLLEE